jgi:hypothetical protein
MDWYVCQEAFSCIIVRKYLNHHFSFTIFMSFSFTIFMSLVFMRNHIVHWIHNFKNSFLKIIILQKILIAYCINHKNKMK